MQFLMIKLHHKRN